MKREFLFLVFSICLVSPLVHAQDSAPVAATNENEATVTPGASETPGEAGTSQRIVVVVQGDPAPFSGLLLRDSRYVELKEAQFKLNNAEYEAQQEQDLRKKLQVVLDSCLEDEKVGQAWYESFWAGAVFGVGAAILVGWVGLKLLGNGD